ncbi:hypothetical protein GXW82_43490 [Streptacidiphilus sp. 4-A2]|nr:hypothetical protein [Streptacidiphilus sp. 4-A2]
MTSFPTTPASEVAYVADRLVMSDDDHDKALAGLLNYIADTWNKQDLPIREHAHYVATTWRAQDSEDNR